jgi:hypothetical protein
VLRRLMALVFAVGTLGLATSSATASAHRPLPGRIELPKPVTATATFGHLGLRPDRRLKSHTPGDMTTQERVEVAVDGRGTPAGVALDERLRIPGTGDYLIYERGPARAVRPIGASVPPVLELGTVLWQGFSPGDRVLAAHLRLDPVLENARLPLHVALSWRGTDGSTRTLSPTGEIPGPGTVTVRLSNATTFPQTLPSGTGAPRQLAAALDTLRRYADRTARRPTVATVLPVAGAGLPRRIAAANVTSTARSVSAPLRVVGAISGGAGATLAGPTVRATADGGRLDGVLSASVAFTLTVPRASRLHLDLTAVPTVDPRLVAPPAPARSWTSWARAHPPAAAVTAATDTLVVAAASTARGRELSPYVGSDVAGPAATSFHFSMARARDIAAQAPTVHAKPYAITLAAIAGLAVLVNAGLLWRRL